MTPDKTTIITGASGGIGKALARHYLAIGHNLVLAGRNGERLDALSQELGEADRVATVAGDLRDLNHVERIVDLAVDRFGPTLANLINNAGTFLVKPFLETEPAALREFQELFAGTYFLTKSAAVQMNRQASGVEKAGERGSIVFISTMLAGGFISQFPCSAVASVKSGYAGFTRNAAFELAAMGIRVNTLELGVVETPIYGLDSTGLERLSSMQPLKRNGSPDDVAQTVRFLTEESPYTTGQVISVDGGVSAGLFGGN